MAEKLGFDELFGNRGAIHFDKWIAAARALGVKGARDELFSGAAFAVNEDAAMRGRGEGDLLTQSFHRNAVAENAVALLEFSAEAAIFLFQAQIVQSVFYGEDGFFERERLFDEVECAKLGGAHGRFDFSVTGDHHDHGNGFAVVEAFKSGEAVDAGKPDIEKNQIERAAIDGGETFFAGSDGFHFVTFLAEKGAEGLADAGFVVNDENGCRHAALRITQK